MLDTLGIDLKFLVVTAVGFVCMFLILRKFAWGPILGMLQERQDTIRRNYDEAESRRNEMVRLQKEYEAKLAQIEDEARSQIQVAIKQAQAARDEILAKAQAESAAIVKRGQEDASREFEKAMLQMRGEIAELAIAAASKVIRQNLDGANHAKLIDDVIAGMGRNGSSSASAGGTA